MKNVLITVMIILLAAAFASQVPHLDIDLSLSQRFVGADATVETYNDFTQTFGPEPALAVMVRTREGTVWDDVPYERIRRLTDELSHVQGIERVISIGSVPGLETTRGLMRKLPLVRKLMMGIHDNATLILIEPFSEKLSPVEGSLLVTSVREVLVRYADPSWTVKVTGPLVLQREAIRYSRIDLKHVTAIVIITMLLILGFAFRSVRGTLGPLLVALITVSITLGIIALAKISLSQFALIAVPVLVGLGILDSVHIVHAYNPPRRKLPLVSCAWTSITTLIGFIVLVSSPIAQVRSIGLVIAIGVPISFAVSFTFLPAFLMVGRGAGRRFDMFDPFERWASSLAAFVERHAKVIVVSFGIATLVISSGMIFLHMSLDFPHLFRARTSAHKTLVETEKTFAGAASIEVVLDAKHPEGFLDAQTLKYAANFIQGLNLSSNVRGTTSFLDAGVSALVARGADIKGMRLGDDKMKRLIGQVRNDADGRILLRPWITDDLQRARIHVKLSTRTPEHFDKLDVALKGSNESFGDWFSVEPTGFGYLYKSMEKVMFKSFLSSFIYALIGIAIALMIIACGLKRGIASVLANLLPIGMVLGLMGWLGVGISVGVIILPAVGLGLLTDDTIHFMMALRRAGGNNKEAVEQALRETGWPLVMTQLILLAVFGSLIASNFVSNVTLGIFMSLLLIIGLAFDLFFVPAFLLYCRGGKHLRD